LILASPPLQDLPVRGVSGLLHGEMLSLNPWMGRLFDRRVNSENAF
jgi:hypothetical protein